MPCEMTKGTPEGYHFKESGLDYVYLLNGYEIEEEDGEEFVTIHNADKLQQEIARTVLLHKSELEAQEVRFLRSLLGITQKQLADYLGVSDREVQRWEDPANSNNIKAGNDCTLRILVWEKYLGEKGVIAFLERCKSEREHYKRLSLMESSNAWKLAEAA